QTEESQTTQSPPEPLQRIAQHLTRRVEPNNNGVNLAWDAHLGTWYFDAPRTYIRAAACFRIDFSNAQAIDASACAPLAGVPSLMGGYGPPSGPFNSTWPCANPSANSIAFLEREGSPNSIAKNRAWINCVYGSWLWMDYPAEWFQTRGVVAATCV
ncbi:hypothetical protein PMAYCL1PPCAC_32301, partial [Pristionchus mayeri]